MGERKIPFCQVRRIPRSTTFVSPGPIFNILFNILLLVDKVLCMHLDYEYVLLGKTAVNKEVDDCYCEPDLNLVLPHVHHGC